MVSHGAARECKRWQNLYSGDCPFALLSGVLKVTQTVWQSPDFVPQVPQLVQK